MFIHTHGIDEKAERVAIRTADPEFATETFRAFSSESVLKISRWNGSDFHFGYGVKRLPHISLIRFRLRNASITRAPSASHEQLAVTLPLRNSIDGLGAWRNGEIGSGMMRLYGADEAFDSGFRSSDVFTVKIQQQWAEDIAGDLAGDIVDPRQAARMVSSRDGYGASMLRLIMHSWAELSGDSKHPAAIKQACWTFAGVP